jgi:hypothetical protein
MTAPERQAIEDAAMHLRVALAQVVATDDRIIVEHMVAARSILTTILTLTKGNDE